WDAESGQPILTFKGATQPVRSVAFSPDGKRIVSGSGGGFHREKRVPGGLQVWDAQTGQEILSLNGHTPGVTSAVYSPDGKRIGSGSDDATVRLWDAQTGRELLTLREHTGGVPAVAYSPDGKRFASAGGDGTVKVWDEALLTELLGQRAAVGK